MGRRTLNDRVQAARVYEAVADIRHRNYTDYWQHLTAIHAAPKWLWPALVKALQTERWTAETTRKNVQTVSETPEPPTWTDQQRIAEQRIVGTLLPKAIAKFTELGEETKAEVSEYPDKINSITVLDILHLEPALKGEEPCIHGVTTVSLINL
jgi:hypothetical protein